MSEQLTQAEIDALRNAVRAGNVASAAEIKLPDSGGDVKVITYDFRKPKLLSAERMVKLQLVHQTLLKNLQSMLFSMFKIAGDSTLNALEQVSYGEFLLSLAAPTYLLSLDVEPDVGLMGVEMSPPMGQILLDMLLGGNGNAAAEPPHEFTAFEMDIMRTLSDRFMEELETAWKQVHDVTFKLNAQGVSPEQVQIAPPDTPCLIAVIDMRLNEKNVRMHLCYPFNSLRIVFERAEGGRSDQTGKRMENRQQVLRALQQTPLPMNVELGRAKMSARELGSLAVGDVIKLEHAAGDPLRLNVGDRMIGSAYVGALRGRLVAGVNQIMQHGKQAAPGKASVQPAAPAPAPAPSPRPPVRPPAQPIPTVKPKGTSP